MTKKLLELCISLDMPQPVTEEVLTLCHELPLPTLRPAMELLFHADTWENGRAELSCQFGDDPNGMKMLTCMLLCALETRKHYQKMGIADSVFLATMDCFPRFVREHRESYGCYGFDRDFWTVRQLSCVLFRIGLLEYELEYRKICLHIPTGAHLIPEAIDASLEEAQIFLAQFFPEWASAPKECHSWLLSPQLPTLLPEESNILKFQRRFRVTPEPEQTKEFLAWVFKNRDIPYPQLPENTSLQRILKQHLLQGGIFLEGRGILL